MKREMHETTIGTGDKSQGLILSPVPIVVSLCGTQHVLETLRLAGEKLRHSK